MGLACLGCAECGHVWRAALPLAPRAARAGALAAPMVAGGAIGAPTHLAMLWVVGVGLVVGLLAFRICTPPCPNCGSERTLRRRFDLRRDARVIEGEGGDRRARRARVG